MLNNDRDKEMARNQTLAIVLMCALLFVWLNWFAPAPKPPEPQQPEAAAQSGDERDARDASQAVTVPDQSPVDRVELSDPGQWPGLGPIPDQSDPAADEVVIEDPSMRLVFTRIGARLKEAHLKLGREGKNGVQIVPVSPENIPDTQTTYPLGLRFTDPELAEAPNYRRFDVVDRTDDSVVFELPLGNFGVLQKEFRVGTGNYVLNTAISYRNQADETRRFGLDTTPAAYLYWGPDVESGDTAGDGQRGKGIKQTLVLHRNGENITETTAKFDYGEEGRLLGETEWAGVKSAYFVVAMRPESGPRRAWAAGREKRYRFGFEIPRFVVEPGEAHRTVFDVYMGPNQMDYLEAGWPTLQAALRFFESDTWAWLDWFSKKMLGLMNWFYRNVVANYGLAIIFVTIIVRMAMFPLTLKSMKSMKRMQLLAPEIEALKEKYGEDQQQLQQKMMELYKERGVNPVGGCFPLLLQMPVFIAFYRMIWSAYELRGEHFMFWITDLSAPDRMFAMPWIPFETFQYFNLLPILMGLSMILSQKVAPTSGPVQNPQQKIMMNAMPVFFAFICYNMASGTTLYILTSTLLGIAQQRFIRPGDVDKTKPKKKTVGKGQHFYTAAVARKRQQAREAKKAQKKNPKS